MNLKTMATLIKREYWENYPLLYRLPLWLGVIIAIVVLALSGLSHSGTIHFHGYMSGQMQISRLHPIMHLIKDANIIMPLFSIFLWITLFTYALRTLFTDRKDGSVFFWNSMPTPQYAMILSKLITLLIIAPFCSWIFLSLTQWIIYIAISIGHFGFHFGDFSMGHFFIVAIKNMLNNLLHLWLGAIWLLPILGLCFISGAYAKRSPAVPVFVCIFLISILDFMFTKSHIISGYFLTCFTYSINGLSAFYQTNIATGFWTAPMTHFVIGLCMAMICFIIAGVIRSKNLDFKND
jgi:ABC-2 type transport system permease protein